MHSEGIELYSKHGILEGDMDTPSQNTSAETGYISRRERRMLERQGQRGTQSSQKRKRILRRFMIWGIGGAVIVGAGWGIIKLSSNVQLPVSGGTLAVPVSAADHVSGTASASIVLVEYSDYQCPACASFYPIVKQLLSEPGAENVRFVYRNFPLTQIHPNAQLAAQTAEAAALQGKFWEMHDILFENQTKWAGMSGSGARATFEGYAAALGLDVAKFKRDVDSSAVKEKIKADYDGGVASGVNATPSFFINGKKMAQPQSYDQFKQAVLSGRAE
jgi:protein-disulfide isomerase